MCLQISPTKMLFRNDNLTSLVVCVGFCSTMTIPFRAKQVTVTWDMAVWFTILLQIPKKKNNHLSKTVSDTVSWDSRIKKGLHWYSDM